MCTLTTETDLSAMYEKYFSRIFNFVFYRLLHREHAEDVVSDVFFKVISNHHRFDPSKASFSTWIFTIAENSVIDHFRKRRRFAAFPDGANAPEIPVEIDFEEQYEKIYGDDRKKLYAALAKLDDRERRVISLKYFGGFANRDISSLTGINESTVSTICARTLSRLRALMGGLEEAFET